MENPVSLRAAIDAACLQGGLSAEALASIQAAASASPVPVIVATMNAVHGDETASEEWRQIGAACAAMVAEHDWFGQGAHAASLSF